MFLIARDGRLTFYSTSTKAIDCADSDNSTYEYTWLRSKVSYAWWEPVRIAEAGEFVLQIISGASALWRPPSFQRDFQNPQLTYSYSYNTVDKSMPWLLRFAVIYGASRDHRSGNYDWLFYLISRHPLHRSSPPFRQNAK